MSNVTLSVEDSLLAKSRAYASSQGTSLNGLIRQLLIAVTSEHEKQDWFEGFLLVSDQATGSTDGWKFSRDEVYDGRI
jgi:hypothetical protein